jgi:hypothetical protein
VRSRHALIAAVTVVVAAALASASRADSPPVGPLPPGPVSTIQTKRGELVALALPVRSNGRVWRVARKYDSRVVGQVSEGDLGNAVVLVFKAVGKGSTTIALASTRGETSKAYESRRYVIRVR